MQIVAGGPSSEWSGRRVGCQPPVPLIRGGRSAPRGWIRKEPASPRQQPDLDSRSFSGWTEGCGFLPELCKTRPAPAPRRARGRLGTVAPVLLRTLLALVAGVVLSLAFEPVALPAVVPLAVAGYVLTVRGLRARSAWLPGLLFGVGFYFTHIVWMRAVGTDAWLVCDETNGGRETENGCFLAESGVNGETVSCACR